MVVGLMLLLHAWVMQVHANIREDPAPQKKERSKPSETKNWKAKKLTYDERKQKLKVTVCPLCSPLPSVCACAALCAALSASLCSPLGFSLLFSVVPRGYQDAWTWWLQALCLVLRDLSVKRALALCAKLLNGLVAF